MPVSIPDLLASLRTAGAALAAACPLDAVPAGQRGPYTTGIALVFPLDPAVVPGLADGPTPAYEASGNALDDRIEAVVAGAVARLVAAGVDAVDAEAEVPDRQRLPLKTLARLAGLGWIGKNAMLVTRAYGSAVRLGGILAVLPAPPPAAPCTTTCGTCRACVDACPGGAPSGTAWRPGLATADFFDVAACRTTCRSRALARLGHEKSICGVCIEACPFTRAGLARAAGTRP